ncbi:hypothetical protein RB200_11955 [Streptomyces sp. PmtG]
MSDDRTAWERLRQGWARAESVVIRALLLSVVGLSLAAQFVRPVGDALEDKVYLGGAVVTLVGYVLFDEVRRLRESAGPAARQVVLAGDLGGYFQEALPRDPRIDAIGFTGETVVEQLKRCLEPRDLAGHPHVRLRIIVPDFTKPMEIPGRVNERGKAEDDEELRRDLLAKIVGYAGDMGALSHALRGSGRARLDVEFRALHITPLLKFCLIGREQLFDGIYDQVRAAPARRGPERQVLDLMGYDAALAYAHIDAGAEAREKIRHRGLLFDTLWGLARPLPTRTA